MAPRGNVGILLSRPTSAVRTPGRLFVFMECGAWTLEVTVTDRSNNAVADAPVTLWVAASNIYTFARTDVTGKARFKDLTPFSNGKLTAWKHNYIPALSDSVEVGP